MPVQRPFHVIAMPVFHCMLKPGPCISCCSSFSQLFHWSSLVVCDVRKLLSFCKKFGVRTLWVSAPCRLALAFQWFPLVFARSSEMVLRFSLIAICTLWCSLMFFYEFIDFQMMFVDFRWCLAIDFQRCLQSYQLKPYKGTWQGSRCFNGSVDSRRANHKSPVTLPRQLRLL